jgi:outer membrane receptor protein involved in Fe transport
MQQIQRNRPVGVGCLLAALLAGHAAVAQDELEQVIVTGSRIARPDFDSASPIVSVTEELFQRSGSGTVETTLNTLPQFVPSYTSTSNNPGNGGQANVSLRGLGTTSTLVLVDGKRLMPANGNGVVDLNIIPSALIESVEIITGGASAVYGSDALAGVVNFKLKRDFDGVEIDGTWGQTDRGDGTQYEAGLTAGTDFADGRGSVMGFVGYADRELVTYADREFSKYPLTYIPPAEGTAGPGQFLPAGSPTILEGRVDLIPRSNLVDESVFDQLMQSYGYAPGEIPFQALDGAALNISFGFNGDGTIFSRGGSLFAEAGIPAVGNFRGARDPAFFNPYVYSYNFAPDVALQMPLERKSAFLRADFDVTDSARVFVQGLYADYTVSAQLASTPMQFAFVPVTNPYIPADLSLLVESRPDPLADLRLSRRFDETGPRVSKNDYDVYQITLGVDGSVFDDWRYEVYAQIGANDQIDTQTGNVLLTRIEELTFAPDGGVSICGGFDPFGAESVSAECMAYISTDASNHAWVDQSVAEASLSGPLLAMPAGDMRAAFGVFYKEDKYQYTASPGAAEFLSFNRPNLQGFNASDDIKGDDHNLDLYAELLIPLLRDVRGIESLETVVGYRSSDYASAGRFDSWKAELIYQPLDSLRVRGSYQDAVRAPSVYELYLPQLPAGFGFDPFLTPPLEDPCALSSGARNGPDGSQVEALCLAQGMPAALLPTYDDSDYEPQGVTGGNPDLGQEEASTTTLGVVWTSPLSSRFLSNLQVAFDWYGIDITNKIEDVFFEDFVPWCYDPRYNPEFSVGNQWCGLFGRDRGNRPAGGLAIRRGARTAGRELAGLMARLVFDRRGRQHRANGRVLGYCGRNRGRFAARVEVQPSHELLVGRRERGLDVALCRLDAGREPRRRSSVRHPVRELF